MNAETLDQRFLFNFPKVEEETITQSTHATKNLKSGDIGELQFDAECAKLNLAPFRPALTNGPIDRLLLLPNGQIKKIHVKAAVLRNTALSRKGTSLAYVFQTSNSVQKADYYFCVGLRQDYSVAAVWWIPWSIRMSIWITIGNYLFDCYLRCPFKVEKLEDAACP